MEKKNPEYSSKTFQSQLQSTIPANTPINSTMIPKSPHSCKNMDFREYNTCRPI